MIRRPPRSTLFPTRRSSDLVNVHDVVADVLPEFPRILPRPRFRFAAIRIEYGVRGVEDPLQAGRFVEEFERRSEEHTSELQSLAYLVCRLLLEKKKNK